LECAAMLSRLGKRGHSVQEKSPDYRIDFDSDPDFDPDKPNAKAAPCNPCRTGRLPWKPASLGWISPGLSCRLPPVAFEMAHPRTGGSATLRRELPITGSAHSTCRRRDG
jgi:hypothetical protein